MYCNHISIFIAACGTKQEADIMFLMDSVNAGRRNTKKSLAFLKSIVSELDIDNHNIHVGLMSAECEQDIQGFGLGSHESRKQIEETFSSMKGTDFHKIIHNMRRGSFRSSAGARKHAKKIAILIVDGSLEEPIKTLTETQRAKIRGIEVFVIQVSKKDLNLFANFSFFSKQFREIYFFLFFVSSVLTLSQTSPGFYVSAVQSF